MLLVSMSWLQSHLESFVQPYLGFIPGKESEPHFLEPSEMSVVKNAWRSAKAQAKGKVILLPGRDVWIFEVLARRENYPTKFIPQCSRLALEYIKIDNAEDYFLLDTGFAGSIPKGLGIVENILLSSNMKNPTTQVFPKRTGARHLALRIEGLPKYWKSGIKLVETPCVKQELADLDQFRKAAILTQQVYCDSSPKFYGGLYDGKNVRSESTKENQAVYC